MHDAARLTRQRVLDPHERIAEILFGLIMVLTFTGSLSAAEAGRDDIRIMLIGALGCNIAWGVIDAILYLMASLSDRNQSSRALRAVQGAADPKAGQQVILDHLPHGIAEALKPAELEGVRQWFLRQPPLPEGRWLTRHDFRGALAVFLLVFLSTFPVVMPFLLMHEARPALRVSNVIAVGLLFLTGFAFGRVAGHRPWLMGLAMVILGSALVGLTIALGG